MSQIHTGNVVPEIMKEEHDGVLNAKRIVSAATVYAVVNTAAAGQSSVVLDTGANWIGLATVVGDVNSTLQTGANWVGLATVNVANTVTVETTTTKTLLHQTIAGNTSGNATLFVPTGTFKIVHLTLSAGATVGVNIMSGVTYLTGNASLNMTLFPGGGWVENGTLDAPIYDGLADASGLVIKTDTLAELAGKIVYYEA